MNSGFSFPSSPTELARSLFLEDLEAELDDVLNRVNKRFSNKLTRNVVANIQRDVRLAVERAQRGADENRGPARPMAQSFANHPRLATKPPLPPAATTDVAPAAPSLPRAMKESSLSREAKDVKESSPEEREQRKQWFNQWAETHYMSTVAEARQALLDKFKVAFGTDHISKTLRLAKDKHKALQQSVPEGDRFALPPATNPRIPSVAIETPLNSLLAPREQTLPFSPVEAQKEAEAIARRMRRTGIRKIEIFEDGTFSFHFSAGRIHLD